MKMTGYYLLHATLGAVRKLFRSSIILILIGCLAIGIITGVSAGLIADSLGVDPAETVETEEPGPEEAWSEGEEAIPPQALPALLEMAVGVGALALFSLNILSADKSGAKIFLLADTALLFPSPRSPQGVLGFRTAAGMGTIFFFSVYFGFQVPSLAGRFGLTLFASLSLFIVWFFILLYSRLFAMLFFVLCSTHPRLKKALRLGVYLALAALALAFGLYIRFTGLPLWDGAQSFFNAPFTRAIPVWGYLKALPVFAAQGELLWAALCFVGLAVFAVLLALLIRRLPADFYEEAATCATETAQILAQMQEQGHGGVAMRKKERKEADFRELSLSGEGAKVYFFKSLANRFRLAKFRVFTKTSIAYLLLAALGVILNKFTSESRSVLWIALPLALGVFIRSFGNPVLEDVTKPFFYLIPASAREKVFWSFLGGTAGTLLDLLPAYCIGAIALGAVGWEIVIWFCFLVGLDFYASSFGLFADLVLPEGVPQQVKSSLQVLLIYLSLVPLLLPFLVGVLMEQVLLGVFGTIAVQVLIGGVLVLCSPGLIASGRK